MEPEYCVCIDRRTAAGAPKFIYITGEDLEWLREIAEAAYKIPYVKAAKIHEKSREIEGVPLWGQTVFEMDKTFINGAYYSEDQFRRDLGAVSGKEPEGKC